MGARERFKLRDRLSRTVCCLDPAVSSSEDTFKAAVVMLAALEVGPNADRIAKLVGYPRTLVRIFGRRLRECGVWDGGVTKADWGDEKTGTIAFWCDVGVAVGWLKRV